MRSQGLLLALGATLLLAPCFAQAARITLPDTSQTTTLQVSTPEQLSFTVPSLIDFGNVTIDDTNKSAASTSAGQTVTLKGIALAPGKKVRISLSANAANFTPASGGAAFAASDVSWDNGTAWTNATGAANPLANGAFNEVATSVANPTNPAMVQTNQLKFTLGAHNFGTAAVLSGAQTLTVTWKVESI